MPTTERAKQLQQAIRVHSKNKFIHGRWWRSCARPNCALHSSFGTDAAQGEPLCSGAAASPFPICAVAFLLRHAADACNRCRLLWLPSRRPLRSTAAAPPDSPPPSCEPLPPSSFFLSNAATFLMELDLDGGRCQDWGRWEGANLGGNRNPRARAADPRRRRRAASLLTTLALLVDWRWSTRAIRRRTRRRQALSLSLLAAVFFCKKMLQVDGMGCAL